MVYLVQYPVNFQEGARNPTEDWCGIICPHECLVLILNRWRVVKPRNMRFSIPSNNPFSINCQNLGYCYLYKCPGPFLIFVKLLASISCDSEFQSNSIVWKSISFISFDFATSQFHWISPSTCVWRPGEQKLRLFIWMEEGRASEQEMILNRYTNLI